MLASRLLSTQEFDRVPQDQGDLADGDGDSEEKEPSAPGMRLAPAVEALAPLLAADALGMALPHAHGSTGNSFHSRPSKSRSTVFGRNADFCLKKNATPRSTQRSRICRTHSRFRGRNPAPLSPPTITPSIPSSGKSGIGPSNGSRDRNRTAGNFRIASMRQ